MKFDYKARPSDVLYRFDVTTTIDGEELRPANPICVQLPAGEPGVVYVYQAWYAKRDRIEMDHAQVSAEWAAKAAENFLRRQNQALDGEFSF